MRTLPFNDLNSTFKARFGCRVHKITVDAGFTCPNRDGAVGTGGCIYCNSRGSGAGVNGESITQQLLKVQPFIRKRFDAKKFIAYFQSFSNTYAPVDRLRRLYEEALAVDDIVGLAIGTRPDCVGDDVLDLLAELSQHTLLTVEYGLQSIHDRTLDLINRRHSVEVFRDAVRRTRDRGIDITVHVIIGLPGESRSDMLETARAIADMDLQGVKIHLMYVVRGTELHRMYDAGEYHCLSREEYIDIVCDFLELLPPDMIIHRLTGDPHRKELVAPDWALKKEINLKALYQALADRDIKQGKKHILTHQPSIR